MKKLYLTTLAALLVFCATATAQNPPQPPPPAQGSGIGTGTQEEKLSELLAKRLEELPPDFAPSREEREEAYARLLEGQRYLWSMRRMRSTNPGIRVGARMAKNALEKAVEIDPKLAEGYTALAELVITAPPQDIEEAIRLSEIAVSLDSDNFGGYRFLGRLYTIKSNLGRSKVVPEFAASAISAWRQVARLDPRNAEAWAFLSAFYEETDQTKERIDALRNWLGSAAPVEQGFYSRVMRTESELSPEGASLQLGEALLAEGKSEEALEILTRAISDDPENLEAVDMLGQALEDSSVESLSPVIEALRQAVYANPDNLSLNRLLARSLARSGSLDEGAKVLEAASTKNAGSDARISAEYLVSLGDILSEAGRPDAAINAYDRALKVRKINKGSVKTEDNLEFARLLLSKKVEAEKSAGRYAKALEQINDARDLLPSDDLTPDKELIALDRLKGDKESALAHVRSTRSRAPQDYSLLRTEASVLTAMGKVDEAVELVRALIDKKPADREPSVMYDDFVNYIFISSLYNQAGEGSKAIIAATSAFSAARGEERRQIAKLTLASAQQSEGDFQSAEKNLREILEESPKNPIALNNLGYLFLESGKNFEEALELIQGAVKVDPKNPSYLDSLGWAYFKLGKLETAEFKLRKALRFDPVSGTILEHLGDVLKASGKESEAKVVWEKAIRYLTDSEDIERISKKLGR